MNISKRPSLTSVSSVTLIWQSTSSRHRLPLQDLILFCSPYFKVYRIRITASSNCKCVHFYASACRLSMCYPYVGFTEALHSVKRSKLLFYALQMWDFTLVFAKFQWHRECSSLFASTYAEIYLPLRPPNTMCVAFSQEATSLWVVRFLQALSWYPLTHIVGGREGWCQEEGLLMYTLFWVYSKLTF